MSLGRISRLDYLIEFEKDSIRMILSNDIVKMLLLRMVLSDKEGNNYGGLVICRDIKSA
jgi:hypothetical protein